MPNVTVDRIEPLSRFGNSPDSGCDCARRRICLDGPPTPAEPRRRSEQPGDEPAEIPPGKLVGPAKTIAKDLNYVGVGGCSAAACHGGPLTSNPARMWNCSYTIWATQEPLELAENRSMKSADRGRLIDKHNRAYAVLYDERAKRMVQLLDHLPDADAAQPYKDARCIACHSVPRSGDGADQHFGRWRWLRIVSRPGQGLDCPTYREAMDRELPRGQSRAAARYERHARLVEPGENLRGLPCRFSRR